jgi:hypothetical protein
MRHALRRRTSVNSGSSLVTAHGFHYLKACPSVVRSQQVGACPPPCVSVLRRALACVYGVILGCLAACEVQPSSLPTWAVPSVDRSQSVSAALHVTARAASIARTIETLPPSTCRAGLGDQNWMQAQVRVEYVRKHRGLTSDRMVETIDWHQDEDGDVSSRRTMTSRLPDGRFAVRNIETRRVGQRWYRGLDGHFADAGQIANMDSQLHEERFRLVDELLSTVRLDGGLLAHASALGGSLCGLPQPVDLTAAVTGRVRWSSDGRAGWIRWSDEHGTSVTVQFLEQLSLSTGDEVAAPEQIYPVERDRSWEEIDALVQRGMDEGWLTAPRALR